MRQQFKAILFFVPMALSYGMLSESEDDSTRTYHADEVVVTATRSAILSKDSPSPVQVLTVEDILHTNGTSVADVLRSSGSVFLKDRGPTASLKTVSFRGMAAEHILVLLDGTRINSFQNGQVDFSLLPMQNVDRIEVVRDGNSALYGADALGGIINIISSRPTEMLQIRANASVGSFDYRQYTLETRGRVCGLGLVAGFMHDRADGDYPFIYHRIGVPDTSQRRIGADFERTQLYLNSDFHIDDRSAVTVSLQQVETNQGVPGSLTLPSNARQDDDAVAVAATMRDNHIDGFLIGLNFGFQYGLQKYSSLTYQFSYYSKTTSVTINPQIQWIVNPWDRLILGGEFVEGRLEGMLPGTVISRIQRSGYISNEMFFQRESSNWDRLSLYQTVRYDVLSEGEEAFSPKIGFNLRVLRDWDTRIRASYGKNFRMPTFNDLYDVWLGNPKLKPEHSECFDVGVETAFDRLGIQTMQFTYFNIDTRDRILPNALYFPVNIYQAQSSGVEGRYDLHLPGDAMHFYADVAMNKALRQTGFGSADPANGKQLLYIPRVVSSFGFSFRVFKVNFNVIQTTTSKRFTAEDESESLPAYSLVDINIFTTVQLDPIRLNLRTEVSNVFDNDYQVMRDYPMPGRTYKVGLSVEY